VFSESKVDVFVLRGKIVSVQRIEAHAVAKWCKRLLNHFKEAEFFVAGCYKFFGQRARHAEGKNLATMLLKCEKSRNKM
jgi:hypothetical protein